ncbi:hypothetical protein [Salinicoccus roseus]|uniref:Uncharacterized protein n=1 Tax=Salinicoccus roseus TaxID=45670 RepID=A0A265E5P4_9STAP|nr:hypothetical protein [Salinicoccus roseus]OZT76893.1 hypothetical protein CFN03_07380 [Salinicoccus roseus]
MNKIRFENIHIQKGRIDLDYEDTLDQKGNLYFELNVPVSPRNDLIALALSTLCGQKYDAIHIGLSISQETKGAIESFCRAEVSVEGISDASASKANRNNVTLNFSGGFDSLAALALMPRETQLVSMDFGGPFQREMPFIERFDTAICRTNIIDTDFRRNSWMFMGIGSILLRDYLQTDFNTFGSILGASVISDSRRAASNTSPAPFKEAGMENAPYVMTLTEAATAKVAMQANPDMIRASLNSLANPKEEKRYRKQLLVQAVAKRHGLDIEIDAVPTPSSHRFKWGENFQADFITLYLMKHLDQDTQLTVGEIPESVHKLVESSSFDFYERYNPNFITHFPKELRAGLLQRLNDFDLLPYTENDWVEFSRVREMLKIYYNIV